MEINKYIEHTLLNAQTSKADVEQLCRDAIDHQWAAVCVPPFYVRTASDLLQDHHNIKVITAIGYPMGYHAIPVKVEEIKRAIDEGVDEIEVVANISAVKDGNWSHVRNDIDSVTTAAHLKSKKARIVLEVHLLSNQELQKLCEICAAVQVDGVKTSTDYTDAPATTEQLKKVQQYTNNTKVVVAGNIKQQAFIEDLVQAGAYRVGLTASAQITP